MRISDWSSDGCSSDQLLLNARNVLIRDEIVSEGSVDQAAVYAREIIRRALEHHASALILVHNHPSGDPKPSRDDIQMTRTILDAARLLGIAVHDHVIIGRSGHASFKRSEEHTSELQSLMRNSY